MKPENYFRRLLFVFIASYSFLVLSCYSQPSITWQKWYDRPGNPFPVDNSVTDLCESNLGNYFIVGYDIIRKALIYKINDYGDTLFTKEFGNNFSRAYCVTQSSDGGCVFAGGIADSNYSPFAIYATKMNSNGSIQWNSVYSDNYNSAVYDIQLTVDNGYIGCGIIDSNSSNLNEGLLFKINSNGNIQWRKIYQAGFSKSFQSVLQTTDGGFMVTGTVLDQNPGQTKTYIMETDSFGNMNWEKKHLIFNRGSSSKKIVKTFDGYLIGGNTTDSLLPLVAVPYIMRTDLNGDMKFVKLLNTNKDEYLHDIKILSPNRYIIAIERYTGDSLYSKVYISDSMGNIIKQGKYYVPGSIIIESILPLQNGDFMFCGIIDVANNGNDDAYMLRTDSNLVTTPIGILPVSNFIPKSYKLYNNYPNPFNPITNIKFDIPKFSHVEIYIYDILGRKVENIDFGELMPGVYNYKLTIQNWSSGIYFASLIVNKVKLTTLKIMYVK